MLRDATSREVLKTCPFSLWFRYIDDVRILNNPKAQEMLSEIYPPCLALEPTCTSGSSPILNISNFLDIQSTLFCNGQLSFHTIFKTESLPFTPIQYIKLQSNRPTLMCFNTLKSLTYSIASRASSPDLLFLDLVHVLRRFAKNGFPLRKSANVVLQCLSTTSVPAASVDLAAFAKKYKPRFLFLRKH